MSFLAALFCTNLTYSISAVISNNTTIDILDGLVSIMLISYYCGLGVYSHRLGYRLFVHPKFTDLTRLHSKTVAKLNAAILVFVMMALFIVAVNLHHAHFMYFRVPLNDTSTSSNAKTAAAADDEAKSPGIIICNHLVQHCTFVMSDLF